METTSHLLKSHGEPPWDLGGSSINKKNIWDTLTMIVKQGWATKVPMLVWQELCAQCRLYHHKDYYTLDGDKLTEYIELDVSRN